MSSPKPSPPTQPPPNSKQNHIQQQTPLLLLPAELRNTIFSLVIPASFPTDFARGPYRKRYLPTLAVIHTCKQLRTEFFKMLLDALAAHHESLTRERDRWVEEQRVANSDGDGKGWRYADYMVSRASWHHEDVYRLHTRLRISVQELRS